MTRAIQIPDHMLFTGDIPDSAADLVLAELEVAENTLSPWQKARLGKITGSNFHKIKRGRGGKGWSQTAITYSNEIVGEWMTKQPASNFTGSRATDWGNEWEPIAIKEYEYRTGQRVVRGKFYKAEKFRLVGATPDGVGKKGLETKCPLSYTNHIRTLETLEVPDEYQDQVNGHILVTKRKVCDYASFHPIMIRPEWKMVIVEVERNKNDLEELCERLFEFEEMLISRLDRFDIDWRDPNYFD